ncbi:MAG: OadG family transporter subunit [Arcobacteraceae bacterium]
METNAIMESVKFMLLGMGVVYAFLIIMIYAIKLQAKIIGKYYPIENKSQNIKPQTPNNSISTSQKVAAMVAAIHHHEQQKKDSDV